MSMTKVIAEVGSCHLGKFDRIKEFIDKAKELNLYAVKFQLFPNEEKYTGVGNIYLSPELFKEAYRYGEAIGQSVTASVFDMESYYFLRNLQPLFIKFAYSQKHQWWIKDCLDHKIEAVVSCDVMTDGEVDKRAVKLYCIPEYPVRYEVAFDGLFPRFDGFSDHTLGLRQTQRAVDAGALFIEKHVRLGHNDELKCPDGRFSVPIDELGQLKV